MTSAAGGRRFVIEEIPTCVRARHIVHSHETWEEGKRVLDFVFLNTDSLYRNLGKKIAA